MAQNRRGARSKDLRTVQRAEILITQRTATFQFLTLACEGRQKVSGYVPWNMGALPI